MKKIENCKKLLFAGVIVVMILISVIGAMAFVSYNNNKISLKQNEITIELGDDFEPQLEEVVKAKSDIYSKISFDSSVVDTKKVNSYIVKYTYKKQELSLRVNVADTTAPVFTLQKNAFVKRVGESIFISELNFTYIDLSNITLSFENNSDRYAMDKVGRFVLPVFATDASGNSSQAEINLTVTDVNDPVINNVKDLTTVLGSEIDLKKDITASDVEDGDITSKLTYESNINLNTVGTYKVTYIVEDTSGNKVANECSVYIIQAVQTNKQPPKFSSLNSDTERLAYIINYGFGLSEVLNWYIFSYNASTSEKIAKVESTDRVGLVSDEVAVWWWNNIGKGLDVNTVSKNGWFYSTKYAKLRAREIVDNIISPSMNEYEKVKTIHDYIVNNVKYDIKNYNSKSIPKSDYYQDGPLLYGTGVCQGYAYAFECMAKCAGIETKYIYGTANNDYHIWNIVNIDDEWYQIDCTWDDPISSDGREGGLRYNYFLITDEQMYKNHTPKYPSSVSCTSTKYMK